MKKPAVLLFAAFLALSWQMQDRPFFEKEEPDGGPNPTDWFFAQRAWPLGFIPRETFKEAQKQAALLRKEATNRGPGWQLAGPTNLGGRVSTIAVHPDDPQTVYVGAANGGIWKTTDGGDNFAQIFEDFPSLSMGDIQIAPSNKLKIYVGTGEANGGGGSMSFDGLGLWKSADAGATWQFAGLENIGSVGKIAVDPTDENRLFVAAMGDLYGNDADRGIYRSLDGGANWTKVLFVNDSTGGIDLAMNPADPNTIFAATFQRIRRADRRQYGGPASRIYRTKDGGETWQKLAGGLPTGSLGRIGIAVAPSDPKVVYAVVSGLTGGFTGIYRSANGGDSWTAVFTGNMPGSFYSNFGWWFGKLWVDPTDANHVFTGGVDFFESKNGGSSWQNILGQPGAEMHVDQHAFWMDPAQPNHFFMGNDGGFWASADGGQHWEKKNSLPIAQFYAAAMSFQNPDLIFGGAQDNGTWRTISAAGIDDWQPVYGGDGFVAAVDYGDPNVAYAEYQYGAIARSDDGGFNFFDISNNGIDPNARTNWVTPYIISPHDPATLFYGAQNLYITTDRGDSWASFSPDLSGGQPGNLVFGTITAIAQSPLVGETIWAGLDDGHVWVTPDFGQTWNDVSAGLPTRWITRLTASPFDAKTAYCAVSGYRWNEPLPHLFKTTDLGATWLDITANLPDAPVNDVLVDPLDPQTLWAAGDMGVFVSHDDGGSWAMLAPGLPNVPVTDIEFHAPSRKLVAATFGRSMYSIETEVVASKEVVGEVASMEVVGNPFSEGSRIDFVLKKSCRARLDLFDAGGRLVKTMADGEFSAGRNSLFVSKKDLPTAGVYVVRLKTACGSASRKLVRL